MKPGEKIAINGLTVECISVGEALTMYRDFGEHRPIREGRFVYREGSIYVAIDNSAGECWAEEFADQATAFLWAAGDCSQKAFPPNEADCVMRILKKAGMLDASKEGGYVHQ